ncbi:sarcosine oxidase [Daldinia decipiens]|uniref:sarcosine oxidase n=1 Tax=Daldinia decipiens TaxID=326647 RepID=UPI0020C590D0|nr:sarcosine oxidase [Daldinia decipiens]KAI1656413.1 sarcosine oxidase [Daldinia decipiens]
MATLIVGAGCFGASTAKFLKEADPGTDVILLDQAPFPDPAAAAHDLNKIIRAEYDDPMYMKLALEAKEAWSQADPIVTPFFHQTGALWSITAARTQTLVDNYETILGPGKSPLEILSLDETRTRFPLLGSCRFEGGAEQCILSPEAGWADAAGALQAVIEAAVNGGVRYEVGTAAKLEFDPDGMCTGVSTTDGRTFPARRIVLSSGAYTPWLLAESAPETPDFHAGNRMKAAAVLMCLFKVPRGSTGLDMFKDAPVIVHPYGDFPAECIPPGNLGGPDLAKCTHEFPYTRNAYNEPSKQEISVPPLPKSDRMTWTRDLPDALKANSANVRNMFFGNSVQGMTPESYRLCWDIATPDEDWIISPHPASKNLYIAAGGSFHGYKFLPIIGKYVVQMLHGELSEEHARRWAWDRDSIPIVTPYTPRGDLRDVPGYYE